MTSGLWKFISLNFRNCSWSYPHHCMLEIETLETTEVWRFITSKFKSVIWFWSLKWVGTSGITHGIRTFISWTCNLRSHYDALKHGRSRNSVESELGFVGINNFCCSGIILWLRSEVVHFVRSKFDWIIRSSNSSKQLVCFLFLYIV